MNRSVELALAVLQESGALERSGAYIVIKKEYCTIISNDISHVAAPSKEISTVKPAKEDTPIQRIVNAYKVAKGIDKRNTAWDKANFSRYSRAAKSLLECFGGHEKAIVYLLGQGLEWDENNVTWTLETIMRHAWDNVGKFKEKENGLENSPVESVGPLEHRGYPRAASTGEIIKQEGYKWSETIRKNEAV